MLRSNSPFIFTDCCNVKVDRLYFTMFSNIFHYYSINE